MDIDPTAASARPPALINVGTYLVVVAASLAVIALFGMRVARVDARHLPGFVGSRAVGEAGARPRPAGTPSAPAAVPVLTDPLELLHPEGDVPGVVTSGNRSRSLVALTFDAGLTPAMARQLDSGAVKRYVNDNVIAELRALDAPATFFLSGHWIERYPDVARDIGGDPLFEVGNHSYEELSFLPGCGQSGTADLARAADDLERNQTMLQGISAAPTRFFRFPGGCYDATSVTAIKDANVRVVQYDVTAGDGGTADPAAIVAHTLGSVRPGSIVVMQATGANVAPATDHALPDIVRQLRARGFRLVRLTDLLQPST